MAQMIDEDTKELSRNKMHISDAGSIVQVKDENRRNTDVFQGLRTQNWAIETSQNAQIISRQFLSTICAKNDYTAVSAWIEKLMYDVFSLEKIEPMETLLSLVLQNLEVHK